MNGLKHNIIDNKYKKWYFRLICKARKENTQHIKFKIHKHHIIPKCIGGTNRNNNLVLLTIRQHYIAHVLLTKFCTNKILLVPLSYFKKYNIKMNSRLFQNIVELRNKECSILTKQRIEQYKEKGIFREKMHYDNIIRNSKIKDWWNNLSEHDKKEFTLLRGKNTSKTLKMKFESGELISPFKNKETHKKTMETRQKNGTNIWITNNPMKDKKRALEIASKRSGENHYTQKENYNKLTLIKNNIYKWYVSYNEKEFIEYDYKTFCELVISNKWSWQTIYYSLKHNIRCKQGNMKNILIKREINENN